LVITNYYGKDTVESFAGSGTGKDWWLMCRKQVVFAIKNIFWGKKPLEKSGPFLLIN
jgi:hypothetical protein